MFFILSRMEPAPPNWTDGLKFKRGRGSSWVSFLNNHAKGKNTGVHVHNARRWMDARSQTTVGSSGKYLFILLWHVEMQQVTVLAVLDAFRLPRMREEATKKGQYLIKILKALRLGQMMIIVLTLSRFSTSDNGYVHCILWIVLGAYVTWLLRTAILYARMCVNPSSELLVTSWLLWLVIFTLRSCVTTSFELFMTSWLSRVAIFALSSCVNPYSNLFMLNWLSWVAYTTLRKCVNPCSELFMPSWLLRVAITTLRECVDSCSEPFIFSWLLWIDGYYHSQEVCSDSIIF